MDQTIGTLIIEINEGKAEHVAGSNRERGTSWDFYSQVGFCSSGELYPERIQIILPEGDPKPYEPGFYLLGAGSIRRGKTGLQVSWTGKRLVPVSEALVELGKLAKAAAGSRDAGLRVAG